MCWGGGGGGGGRELIDNLHVIHKIKLYGASMDKNHYSYVMLSTTAAHS